MKTYFLLPVFFLMISLLTAQKAVPQGVYQLLSAQYGDTPPQATADAGGKATKIFRDGYWMSAFYGQQEKPFGGAGGGYYTFKDGKYAETLYFFSWDSTAATKTYTFDYSIDGNYYHQFGKIQSDQYKDYVIDEMFLKKQGVEPLKNNTLEGVWFLESATGPIWTYDRKSNPEHQAMKIYAYPMTFYGHWNNKTHSFYGAGGCYYQFDGQTLVENVVFTTFEEPGKTYNIKVTFDGDTYTQEFDGNKEVWKKAPPVK